MAHSCSPKQSNVPLLARVFARISRVNRTAVPRSATNSSTATTTPLTLSPTPAASSSAVVAGR